MQILAGKYKNHRLQSSLSPKVKPTARRLRESLFNILGERIIEAHFLDLCAGSGAVGIEALSRGAAHVSFVERSTKMCNFIEMNLASCCVPPEQTDVVLSDALNFLQRTMMDKTRKWDMAFFDPPYAMDYAPVLALFGRGAALKRKRSVLIVEHHCENQLPDTVGFIRRRHFTHQGESCLSFYEMK
jgi:16S rRNA (guanine966-N2)-methyltransferase